jgi:hypothetical protein
MKDFSRWRPEAAGAPIGRDISGSPPLRPATANRKQRLQQPLISLRKCVNTQFGNNSTAGLWMRMFRSRNLQRQASVIQQAATKEPVVITDHDRPRLVLMTMQEYDRGSEVAAGRSAR